MYKELINCSNVVDHRFNNKVIILKDKGVVFSSNGHSAFVSREQYETIASIGRLSASEDWMDYDKASGAFSPATERLNKEVDFSSITTMGKGYKKVTVKFPEWLNSVSKKQKDIRVTLIPEAKSIAVGTHADGITFNYNFLRECRTNELDVYYNKDNTTNPLYFVPKGTTLETAPWYYVVMPIFKSEIKDPVVTE